MQRNLIVLVGIALLIGYAAIGVDAAIPDKPQTQSVAKATSDLVGATAKYKASVETLIPVYEAGVKTATAALETRKQLFDQGLISKRELELAEQAIKDSQTRLEEARRQLTESDQLVAQATAELNAARTTSSIRVPGSAGRYTAANAMLRYTGSPGWSIAQASKVQQFFSSTFGRLLPISAYGQSSTHNRMGLDHRNSVDVALNPDSAEGKALMTFLETNGIPFLAFRRAVAGAATGAHIHVGYPSHRSS